MFLETKIFFNLLFKILIEIQLQFSAGQAHIS